MVAAKMANLPNGGAKYSSKESPKLLNVGTTSVDRAKKTQRDGSRITQKTT
jgi:hypothetical protein